MTLANLDTIYTTQHGQQVVGDSREVVPKLPDGSIDLLFTSPPFALLRQKSYGNEEQSDYVDWLVAFGRAALPKLKETGSFVVDLGGAYERGRPVRSLYNYRVLLRFCDELGYRLAEEFFWHNPAKLPSPIEWVNKRKIRVKDSVNTIWWFSKNDWPKADVRKVLAPYSERMKTLLKGKNSTRPSCDPLGTILATHSTETTAAQFHQTSSSSRTPEAPAAFSRSAGIMGSTDILLDSRNHCQSSLLSSSPTPETWWLTSFPARTLLDGLQRVCTGAGSASNCYGITPLLPRSDSCRRGILRRGVPL